MKQRQFCPELLLLVLTLSCRPSKQASCNKSAPQPPQNVPAAALYQVELKGTVSCMAVQIKDNLVLSSRECVSAMCASLGTEPCEKNLSLRNVLSGELSSIRTINFFPAYERQNFVSIRGSDLVKLTSEKVLSTMPLPMATAENAQAILDDNTGRILDNDRNHLMLAKGSDTSQWMAVNARFPMGVESQEYLVGSRRRQLCSTERGSALIGHKEDNQPYQLIGILSNGYPVPDWLNNCEHSDGNVVSLLSPTAVQTWIAEPMQNTGTDPGSGPEIEKPDELPPNHPERPIDTCEG